MTFPLTVERRSLVYGEPFYFFHLQLFGIGHSSRTYDYDSKESNA